MRISTFTIFRSLRNLLHVIFVLFIFLLIVEICLITWTGFSFLFLPEPYWLSIFLLLGATCCGFLSLMNTFLEKCRRRRIEDILGAMLILIASSIYVCFCIVFFSLFLVFPERSTYHSPNGERELIFRDANFEESCMITVRERRGWFERIAHFEDTSAFFGRSYDEYHYCYPFHDPDNLHLTWHENGKEVAWQVRFDDQIVKGFVRFD